MAKAPDVELRSPGPITARDCQDGDACTALYALGPEGQA